MYSHFLDKPLEDAFIQMDLIYFLMQIIFSVRQILLTSVYMHAEAGPEVW